MKKYILAIDQGTTSSRAIIFDECGHKIAMASREVKCIYPFEGYVEEDAMEIWISVVDVTNEVLIKSDISWNDIDSIGITNQRETTIIWDKQTGLPVYNAIVWQSRQSSSICDSYIDKKQFIHKRTGLLLNPYFSASKIRFILDHIPNGQKRAENGELMFGTIDTWLIYKMTNGKKHLTDVSNASRTMLFNIFKLKWDDELLALFNIPKIILPRVCESSFDYGIASSFSSKVHIYGVAGDQQASLFGHNCFKVGQSKNTYGTGCFMLLNIGDKPILSSNGLLTTVAWSVDKKICYALEGSVFIGGAAIQWLRDGLKVINDAADSEHQAKKISDSAGVYLVPAFVGLGTPYWDDEVKGALFGITRATTKYHIIRATLEAIAFQCKDVFDVMEKESGIKIDSLQVDGGATANNILMQFQSDILGIDVNKPECLETTALGAAYLAGLKSGYWKDINDICSSHSFKMTYNPKMSAKEIDRRYEGWKCAVKATMIFKPGKCDED